MISSYVNKVMHCDCMNILPDIPNNSIDLCILDPPYGMSFQSNHRRIKHKKIEGDNELPIDAINHCIRIANRACYVFCRWDNLYEMPKPKSVIVWVKNNWSMGDLKHEHGRQWEACCFYPKDNHEFIERIPDVIHANRTGNKLHPTEKPIRLLERIISCNVGDTVFDPFAGSGSTLVAAKNLGRKYIGIELEQRYVDICNERLSQGVLNLK
jgi:site-specific DNA-methyltransferase (adenine-specific)